MCVLKATSWHLKVLLTYKLLFVHSLTWCESISASCKMTRSSWGTRDTTIYNHHLFFCFCFLFFQADAEFLHWRRSWWLQQWYNSTCEMSFVDTSVKAFPRWPTPSMLHCQWECRGKSRWNKDTSLRLMCFERSGEVHAGKTFSFSPSFAHIFVSRCLNTGAFGLLFENTRMMFKKKKWHLCYTCQAISWT